MTDNNLIRPALGQEAQLGQLYDARQDVFLPFNMINGLPPASAIKSEKHDIHQSDVTDFQTYTEKFAKLQVNVDLAASILAGATFPSGAGSYITAKSTQASEVVVDLYHTVTTQHDCLMPKVDDLSSELDLTHIGLDSVTHVLMEVTWGARTVVSAREKISDPDHESFCRDLLKEQLKPLSSCLEAPPTQGATMTDAATFSSASSTFTIYSDLLLPGHGMLGSLSHKDACDILRETPQKIAATNDGKGIPVTYTLLPVVLLRYIIGANVPQKPLISAGPSVLSPVIQAFDDWDAAIREFGNLSSSGNHLEHRFANPAEIDMHQSNLGLATFKHGQFKKLFSEGLSNFRTGKMPVGELQTFVDDLTKGDVSPPSLPSLTIARKDEDRLLFEKTATELGAMYATRQEVIEYVASKEEFVVFYYDDSSSQDEQQWNDQKAYILDLLGSEGGPLVALCNCSNAPDFSGPSSVIRYRQGKEVSGDAIQDDKSKAEKCLAQYDPKELDTTDAPQPPHRRPVKIACPGRKCNKGSPQHWQCSECEQGLEYADGYIYCRCGRVTYKAFKFKCGSDTHSKNFVRYTNGLLKSHLDNLKDYKVTNILILGETGVGKSTWVNAFINYLLFDSLDAAIDHDVLEYHIPCSFSMQYEDKQNPDQGFIQRDVHVGREDSSDGASGKPKMEAADMDNEKDGSAGESATQESRTYRISLGNRIIRLIDTPGIGDTRGVQQDEKNMENILATVGQHEKIHGILVLLKPNMSRLTLMFRFYVNELLSHLHRDAANNMVFGFTNTRQTNYMPGDSYKPLEALLKNHKSIDITLSRENVFCFDSESFRFLATLKEIGVEMDNIDDFRKSWERSVTEARRLIDRFESLPPHPTKSTLSLNSVRQFIIGLTKPMADITASIESTIQINRQNIAELEDVKCRGKRLQSRLHFNKIDIVTQRLDRPRTVCRSADCVEIKNIGNDELRPIYKTRCHDPCFLRGVTEDLIGHPDLINCAAMAHNGFCQRCGHQWQEHLHFQFDQQEKIVKQINPDIERQILDNTNDSDLKINAIESIKSRIQEAEEEKQEIQDAAIRFGLFLKANSITPYNDSMIAYLDECIKEQRQLAEHARRGKVPGADRAEDRLNQLIHRREEYEQRIQILEEKMTSDGDGTILDEKGIDDLVKALYSMKNWGDTLRKINTVSDQARTTAYREENFRARSGGVVANFSSWGSAACERVSSTVSNALGVVMSGFANPSQQYPQGRNPTPRPIPGLGTTSGHHGGSYGTAQRHWNDDDELTASVLSSRRSPSLFRDQRNRFGRDINRSWTPFSSHYTPFPENRRPMMPPLQSPVRWGDQDRHIGNQPPRQSPGAYHGHDLRPRH